MLMTGRIASIFCLGAVLQACSTSNHLRKFDNEDLGKEVPADFAKRFEVKDYSSVAPTPSPVPGDGVKGKAKKKGKNGTKATLSAPIPSPPPLRRLDPMPFQEGEKLAYDLRFLGVTAATLELEVQPPKMVGDRQVTPLRGHAKTVRLFEIVYRADDRVESYWDRDGLFSVRFSMDLDETKQNRKLIELYDYQKNQSYFWNRIDHVEKGFREEKLSFDIRPWSQDMLSSLYFLRVAPLPADGASEYRMPVIVDGKPWETVIRYLRTEKIYAGGAEREARVYHMENFSNGEAKNRENTVWISTDEHHYLLRLETKLKVGSFAVALDRIL